MLQLQMNGSIIAVGDLQDRVAELQRNFAKEPPTRSASYGDRLKVAVKRRLAARHGRAGVIANASPDEDSFAQKLTAATKRIVASRKTQKQHREQAEQEKARYHKPVRRSHTPSD